MAEITYVIEERIGVLSDKGGKRKELNKVSWNGRPAKYDIRTWWEEEGTVRYGKGVTLTNDELYKLGMIIDAIDDVE